MLRAGLVLSPLLSDSSFLPSLTCSLAGTQPTALALLTCTHPGAGRRPSLVLPCPSFRPLPAQHSSRPFCSSLRPLDIEFMKRLSKVVNIVPVIAKADTLTLEERVYFKQRVGLSTFLLAGAVRHSTPGFSWRRKIRNGWSPPGGAGGRTSLPCRAAPLRAAVEQEDAPWAAASTRPHVRTTWRTEARGPAEPPPQWA